MGTHWHLSCCRTMSQATESMLNAAANQFARFCKEPGVAFMRCKAADENPETCLTQGAEVTKCYTKVLELANGSKCGQAYRSYHSCLTDTDQHFEKCRDFEKAFEGCMESSQ